MQIVNFTPIPALIGGVILGASSVMLYLLYGRIFGISGILGHLFNNNKGDRAWRWIMLLGLVFGGYVSSQLSYGEIIESNHSNLKIFIGTFIMGFGARLGSGCTSGHGICGISRLSKRSIIATCIFMASGILTVFILKKMGA